jgi:hypothetical protein
MNINCDFLRGFARSCDRMPTTMQRLSTYINSHEKGPEIFGQILVWWIMNCWLTLVIADWWCA